MAYEKLKESLKKYPWYVELKDPSEMTDEDIASLRFSTLSEEEEKAVAAELERRKKDKARGV
jgi:hypothetical protein